MKTGDYRHVPSIINSHTKPCHNIPKHRAYVSRQKLLGMSQGFSRTIPSNQAETQRGSYRFLTLYIYNIYTAIYIELRDSTCLILIIESGAGNSLSDQIYFAVEM